MSKKLEKIENAENAAIIEESKRQFTLIKTAYDHGLNEDPARLIDLAIPEVFDLRVKNFNHGGYQKRDDSLLTYVKDPALQLQIVDRMTSAQLAGKLNDHWNTDKQSNPTQLTVFDVFEYQKDDVFIAMIKKIEGDNLGAGIANNIASHVFYDPSGTDVAQKKFIHPIVDHVIENWPPEHVKFFTHRFIKKACLFINVLGEDRAKKLIERTPASDIMENPDWYEKLTTSDWKTYGGVPLKDHPITQIMAQMIQDKISGALADFTFSAPSVADQEAASIAARQKFAAKKLEHQIEAVLKSADQADAMDVARVILDDCATLFNRIVGKNFEGLGSGLAARDAMETMREQLEVLGDLAQGRKTVDVRKQNRFSQWIAVKNPFSSRVPACVIANGYTEILGKIGEAEDASRDVIRAYGALKKAVPDIQEALGHVETSLSGAVEKIEEELQGETVPDDRRASLEFIRDHFKVKASGARLNVALLAVHEQSVEDNTEIEGNFVNALQSMRMATNVSMTNTAMVTSGIKAAATAGLKEQAALLFEQGAEEMAKNLSVLDGNLKTREAAQRENMRRIADVSQDARLVTISAEIKPPQAP